MSTLYITEQGTYLRKSGGRFVVYRRDEQLRSIPQVSVDRVVIFGNVQVSTQVISEILTSGIAMIYASTNGKFKGILQPGYPRNVYLRLAQYECMLNPEISLLYAQQLVEAKIDSQLMVLRRWKKCEWFHDPKVYSTLSYLKDSVSETSALDQILGIEGAASRAYFMVLGNCLPPPHQWHGRNRQPPKDPVNALLSLTYMMAVGEFVTLCYANALDPFVGFLHHLDYGRPSLVLDMMELIRAQFCDHFVLRNLQKETFTPDDFESTGTHGCRLKKEPFNHYLKIYNKFQQQPSRYRPSLNQFMRKIVRMFSNSIRENSPLELTDLMKGA